ncbi:MAG: alpha/beta fold hydrolase [Gammaproteobacteria bacterium]|jgi:esterase|nr:alpha/beta fold hydrolase [Gammaproteobacteria bacterium]MDP6650816.1 alpha/beta fold hydrolase [Gammaproteobacteria bacterium]
MQLNYRQYSDSGKPLLILHGLFGSLGNWGWHSKQLAEQYAVYGVDLRNHGESPHADELDYTSMADDVKQLMTSLGIDSCFCIGHSMGGKVAMQLALTQPQLVEKLIVVDIAPVTYPIGAEGHKKVLAAMAALDFDAIHSRSEAESKLAAFIQDEATRKFVLTNLQRDDSGKYQWRLNLRAIEEHYDALRIKPNGVLAFTKPTLFVKGSESKYIRAENETEILELFPNASVKIIMQAGHWLHADKPQAFKKIASDFLSMK